MLPDNPGAMDFRVAITIILFSLGLVALQFFGVINVGYWFAATPMLYVLLRAVLYRVITGAFLNALQIHENTVIAEEAFAEVELREQKIIDAVTLDTDKFLRAVRPDDDGMGSC